MPRLPDPITATTVGSGSVTVTWKAAGAGGQPITGYQLVSGTRTLSVSGSTLKATLTGLARNAKVRVGVPARNAVGWGSQALTAYVTTKR